MFDVEVCETRRVVLIRFRGELAEADFTALDALGREKQDGAPYDVIFDMTAVEKIGLATDFISKRGELPQAFTDRERIYVVQQEDLKLLVRLYAAYQTSKGWRPPVLVRTLEEAFGRLGVSASDFGPRAASGVL
jgi:hypothetical protein